MSPFLKEIVNFFLPFLKVDKGKILILLILPILWCFAETAAPYLIKLLIDFLVSLRLNSEALIHMFFYVIIAYSGLILCLEISSLVICFVKSLINSLLFNNTPIINFYDSFHL